MFGRTFEVGEVLGFRVRVDVSWFLIAALVTWSLASFAFPDLMAQIRLFTGTEVPEPAPAVYWLMGLTGALLLFASVLAHELSHALVARQFGIEMRGITLFIFGGVAEMSDEPPSAGAELQVALAGPVASLLIGFLFAGLATGGLALALPPPVIVVTLYLGLVNGLLAVFNLIPAFPLDGGRVLRSALWYLWGDLARATRVTSRLGSGFGLLLIAFGLFGLFTGNVFALWWALIGLFVRYAAQMSYRQLLLRRVLEGRPVAHFMQPDPVKVPRSISVRELVEDYVYRHRIKMFPVVDGDRLVGCVTTRQIRELPREEWERTSVGALVRGCSPEDTVSPGSAATEALAAMSRGGLSRLLVVEGGRLVGILALRDLLELLSLKMELERR